MTAPSPAKPKSRVKRSLALVALLGSLIVLSSLGTWQAKRYINKRDIFDRMETRMPMAVLPVDSASDLSGAELDFRRVRLEGGSFDLEKTVLVPRRFYKHLPGAWVLTPYRFADGSVAVVQRGWVPEESEQEARTPAPDDAVVVGLATLPNGRKDLLARQWAAEGTLDLTTMPQLADLDIDLLYETLAAPRPAHDFLVVLGAEYRESVSVEYPAATDEHLTKPYLTPMTHFGYAFLWYGSALLLIWLFWAGWTGRLSPGQPHKRR